MYRILSLTAVLMIFATGHLSAEMVRYVDEFGKPHYVNSDYSTVPQQYRHQVEAQLKAIEAKKAPVLPIIPAPTLPAQGQPEQPAIKDPLPVTLFLRQNCQECLVMGILLAKEGIPVTTVDINTPEGKQKYDALKVNSLPVAIIGEEIVTGFDPSKVVALAQKKEPSETPETPVP